MNKKSLSLIIASLILLQITPTYANEKIQQQLEQLQEKILQLKESLKQQTKNKHTNPPKNIVYGDGSNALYIEQYPSSSRSLSLLENRSSFQQGITVGGRVEFLTQYWNGSDFKAVDNDATINLENGTGIFLTNANLDFLANIGNWTQIYFATATSQDGSTFSTSARSAVISIGNLKISPFYISAGKSRPVFGSLPGDPWTLSIPEGTFRPGYVNNVTVGYDNFINNLNVNFTYITPSDNTSAFIADAFYTYPIQYYFTIGGNIGYVSNINGTGMSITTSNTANKRTPLFNIEGKMMYKDITFYSGWQQTLNNNPSINPDNKGKTGSWYIESTYQPSQFTTTTIFSLGYAQTYNMSNGFYSAPANAGTPFSIIGPKRQIYGVISRDILTGLTVSLEYAWLETYKNKVNNTLTLNTTVYF